MEIYRGYSLAHNPVSGLVHIYAGNEFIDTVAGIDAAKALIDDWMDAK